MPNCRPLIRSAAKRRRVQMLARTTFYALDLAHYKCDLSRQTMANDCGFSRRGLLGLAMFGVPALFSRDANAASDVASAIIQPSQADDRSFIERAFEMRQLAVESGDQAYGAVVVRAGEIVGQAASHVVLHNDPTAHAEMETIRDAARRLGQRDLSDCSLFSSSTACPMCEAAAYWAGIQRMVSGEAIQDRGRPKLC